MVKSVRIDAYECERCGNKFFEKEIAEKHEKSPEKPRFKLNEEVIGHYPISKLDGAEYAATTFRVLGVKKEEHSFNYTLKLMHIEQYDQSGCYSSPSIFRGDSLNKYKEGKRIKISKVKMNIGSLPFIFRTSSGWILLDEECKKVFKSLGEKLEETVILPENRISPPNLF